MPARPSLTRMAAAAAVLALAGILAGYGGPAENTGGPGSRTGTGGPSADSPPGLTGIDDGKAAGQGDREDAGADDGTDAATEDGKAAGPPAGPPDRTTSGLTVPAGLPGRLPGLGRRMAVRVPDDARQVLLVTGDGPKSSRATAVLHERTPRGWRAGPAWPAHNALRGWTDDHHLGDLRSPRGVFGLTDAGGLLRDPGTRLPYDHSRGFTATGIGFEGEQLAGAFDYVIAIDYNRAPGTSPLDLTRPLGAGRGGGIWIHVDHGGPTHGCVTLSASHMRRLLRALDPAKHPVIVMGDQLYLSR